MHFLSIPIFHHSYSNIPLPSVFLSVLTLLYLPQYKMDIADISVTMSLLCSLLHFLPVVPFPHEAFYIPMDLTLSVPYLPLTHLPRLFQIYRSVLPQHGAAMYQKYLHLLTCTYSLPVIASFVPSYYNTLLRHRIIQKSNQQT